MEAAGVGFFLAAWAASVIWTARDAQRRCGHASLRLGAPLVAILLPFAGAGLYALVKPCEERADVRARRMRTRFLESVVNGTGERCPECATPIQPEFRCCPACGERVVRAAAAAASRCGRLGRRARGARRPSGGLPRLPPPSPTSPRRTRSSEGGRAGVRFLAPRRMRSRPRPQSRTRPGSIRRRQRSWTG